MSNEFEIASLYRRHGLTVFRRALRILGCESEAHEIVQDIFLSLFERPEQFSGRSTVTTFLYSMTTHACLNRLRDQRNRERLLRSWQEQGSKLEVASGLSLEQRLMLQEALSALPGDLAQVAIYSILDGLTHEQIARIMACSRRQVGNLLARLSRWEQTREEAKCCAT